MERKIFPGYVLVKMIMTDDSWYVVRNIRGVTGFVGPGSKPVPLSEEEVQRLGVEVRQIEIDFQVGDSVKVINYFFFANLLPVTLGNILGGALLSYLLFRSHLGAPAPQQSRT